MAASHGQLREYILRKKWDRPAGLAGRFFVLGEDGLPRRCAPRNDSFLGDGAVRIVRRGEGTPPYGCGTWGAVHTGRRGNRRSAAGGGRSEPVSRKCPDWRPRQWTGIGWHDGGQSPPPTDAWQGNSVRGREYGLPRRCAPAMTAFWRCGGYWAGRAFALAFLAFTIFLAKNPPLQGQGRAFFYAGGVRYRSLTVFSLPPLKQAPMISMTTNRPRYHATSHLWE